jgi:hypothetical protein
VIPWSKLPCSVQTGQPSFDNHFGVPFFDHLSGDPEEASTFSDLLIDLNSADAPAVAADYGLSPAHVADIGGATGQTLTPLSRRPASNSTASSPPTPLSTS